MSNKISKRWVVPIIAVLIVSGCARTPQEKAARFIKSGKTHLEKKDYARAILDFKNASQATPTDAEPYYELGLTYLAAGDFRSGVGSLRKATELNPKHTAAQLKLAELMTTARSKEVLEDAQKRMQEILKASPDNVEALDTLALAEVRLGKADLAEQHLKEALEKSPQSVKSAAGLAGSKLGRGDIKGAEGILKKVVDSSPQSVEARLTLAELYRQINRPEDAEQQFRAALKLDPKNGAALLGLGGLQENSGHTEQAEETLKRVSALPDERYRPLYAAYLYSHGRKEAAIAELEKQAKGDPKDRAARTRLIAAYMDVGRTNDAERTISAALRASPKDGEALLQRSEILLRTGRYADAQRDLLQLLTLRPDSGQVHYLLARVQSLRGDSTQAAQELGQALRLNPKLLMARIELAQKLLSQRAARSALSLLNEAPAAQQKMVPFIVERNWALLALGDRAELRKGIDQGLAIARAPDLLLQDALVKTEQKNYSAAQTSLVEASKLNRDDLRLVEALARSYSAQNQAGKALEVVRQHASERPKSAAAQQFLGNWLLKNGDRAGARTAFAAAQAADPTYTAADLALAQLDIAEGKLDAARQRLMPLLTWNADNLWAQASGLSAHVLLGNVEEMSGNHDKAIEHYRRVVELNPSNAMALNNLAYLLTDYANQPDEALKYAQRAKELDPNSPAVADTIGWAFYRKGIYQSAVHNLEAAASANSPRPKYHLAMAYLKAGDLKRGQEVFQEALRLDPNLPEARMTKDALEESLRASK